MNDILIHVKRNSKVERGNMHDRFFKFVNSDTVRNHLQQIRYQPTALEAAWLTWQCETISLEEKCAAWREIIETLPDCPTGSRTMGLKATVQRQHTYFPAGVHRTAGRADRCILSDR